MRFKFGTLIAYIIITKFIDFDGKKLQQSNLIYKLETRPVIK